MTSVCLHSSVEPIPATCFVVTAAMHCFFRRRDLCAGPQPWSDVSWLYTVSFVCLMWPCHFVLWYCTWHLEYIHIYRQFIYFKSVSAVSVVAMGGNVGQWLITHAPKQICLVDPLFFVKICFVSALIISVGDFCTYSWLLFALKGCKKDMEGIWKERNQKGIMDMLGNEKERQW